MEAILSSPGPESDVLVGPLKFGLDPQGSYCQSSREATTFSNVNSASPTGVKAITINVGSSSEWLDPSTILLSFLITNNDTARELFPATVGAHCLFDRLSIRLGSTLVEQISEFGKCTEILTKLSMSPQKRLDQGHIGFGTAATAAAGGYWIDGNHAARKIASGTTGTKRVYMKFDLSGLFSQHRWLPLFALGGQGLQIQLDLAPAAQAMILGVANATTWSSSYTLSDIRLLSTMKSLSGELQESYNAALLNGSSLKMPIKTWEVLVNYLAADSGGSFDIAISKNYTRLATLFAFLNTNPPSENSGVAKLVNTNYFPTASAETMTWALHMGSKRVPDNDVRGISETWWRNQEALGLRQSLAHSTSVDEDAYKSSAFAIGLSTEKLDGVMASGENLSTGQTIFLKCKGFGTTSDICRRATVLMHFESVISIQDTVVEVFT